MKPNKLFLDKPDSKTIGNQRKESIHVLSERLIRWLLYAKKWKKLLALMLVTGIGIGTNNIIGFQPHYDTHLLAHSKYLSNDQVKDIVSNLQHHLREGDYTTVANKLSIPQSKARLLRSVRCVFSPRRAKDNVFQLHMKTTSNKEYQFFEKKMMLYMEGLDYVQQRIIAEEKLNENILESVKIGQQKLDSVERIINQSIFVGDEQTETVPELNEDMTAIFTSLVEQQMELQQRVYKVEQKLKAGGNFEIIQGFEKFTQPSQPNWARLFIFPIVLSFLAWLLLTWFLEVYQEIKRRNAIKTVS